MEERNERNDTIYKTALYFFDNKKPVHISLESGKWLNGIIVSVNHDFKDRLVIIEEKFGEMLVFFDRIQDDGIVPRGVKKKEEVK